MSSPNLTGQVVVITGSTRGLGLAIAQTCSQAGAAVVVSSRHAAAVAATVDAIRAAGGHAAGAACHLGDLSPVVALRAPALAIFCPLPA